MLILGTNNFTEQTVIANGQINIGNVYRKYCKRARSGLPTFATNGTSITLNGEGIYHVTAVFIASGTVAGNITVNMLNSGTAISGATASETITTANTEVRTLVIDRYIKVDNTCALGVVSTSPAVISFVNSGIGSTYANVTVNIDKVV